MSINRLFRREGKFMLAVLLLPVAIGVLAAIVVPPVLSWLAVDRCLDSGGKYDHENSNCVLEPKR